jgi:hypothetical protein
MSLSEVLLLAMGAIIFAAAISLLIGIAARLITVAGRQPVGVVPV